MRTLISHFILCPIAALALAASAALAQGPALSEQPFTPEPPPEITPTSAPEPPAPGGSAPLDPRSRSYLVRSLTESLGLNTTQVAEVNKIIDTTIAEREKNVQEGRGITEKGRSDLVDVLTPEQKNKAAEILIDQALRGPLMPGPGDTGFRKWQPGKHPLNRTALPGAPPPATSSSARPAAMPPAIGPEAAQMLRQRLAAHADDIVRRRAAETLQLTPDQSARANEIEKAREAAVEKSSNVAESQFRATLTKEQLRKYDAIREHMKERMEGRLEQTLPDVPPAEPAEKPE